MYDSKKTIDVPQRERKAFVPLNVTKQLWLLETAERLLLELGRTLAPHGLPR